MLHYVRWFWVFFLLTGCTSQSTIVHNVDDSEANEIIVYLSSKGIQVSKSASSTGSSPGGTATVSMYDITVPQAQATEAMALLNIVGLPRPKTPSLLDIFSNSGLVPSAMQEKIRYQQGLEDEIANTIRQIDGVLDAQVIISFPQTNPLHPEQTLGKTTASVFVKNNGVLDDPNLNLVSKIKRLVASAVPGLSYDNVTVIGDTERVQSSYGNLIVNPPPKLATIWGIEVNPKSIASFQWYFSGALIGAFICLLLLFWTLWKCHHLVKASGGYLQLFTASPFNLPAEQPEAKNSKEEKKEGEEKKDDKTVE